MTTAAIAQPAAQSSDGLFNFRTIARAFRSGLIVALVLGGLAVILQVFLRPLIASTSVEENVTAVLGDALISLLPVFAYLACGSSARAAAPRRLLRAVIAAVIATSVLYVGITAVEFSTEAGRISAASVAPDYAQPDRRRRAGRGGRGGRRSRSSGHPSG